MKLMDACLYLGAETVILGLFVLIAVVGGISTVVAEFVFVWTGHIGVLEVTVVFLLVGRWRIFAIRNNSGHNGTQNQNLKTFSFKVNSSKHSTKAIQLKFKMEWNLNKNKKFSTHHKRSLHVGGCKVRLRISHNSTGFLYTSDSSEASSRHYSGHMCSFAVYVCICCFFLGPKLLPMRASFVSQPFKKVSIFLHRHHTHTHTHTHRAKSVLLPNRRLFIIGFVDFQRGKKVSTVYQEDAQLEIGAHL